MSMQSRRDLFQAHRLMTQRAALALLRGEPDVPDQPLRRANVATFSGLLVAVIAIAAFGIWGLLDHGAPSLKYVSGSATLIIDKQTGTEYLFCGKQHQDICPVLNYSSALLALQSVAPVNVENVNQSSLAGIPHGPTMGIPGLPQDLPGPGLLVKQPWSVCTQTALGVPGIGTQVTTAVLAGFVTGGAPVGSDALLVSDSSNQNSSNQEWVIWDDSRMLIGASTSATIFPENQPVSVPAAWLNAIPQGPAFQPLSLPDAGTLVTGPTGTRVRIGQVYMVSQVGGTEYFVTVQGGQLQPVTPLQALLLEQNVPGQQQLPSSDLTNRVTGRLSAGGLPKTTPQVSGAAAPSAFCVNYSGPGPVLSMQIETGGRMPPVPAGVDDNTHQVSYVTLPPGRAALVEETGDNVRYFLVTGGIRYALDSTAVPAYLGYSTSQAVQLPAGLVDLVPQGPAFNTSEANDPAP